MSLLFLWQWGRTWHCVCLPAWNTWQSCVVPLDELSPLGWTLCQRYVTLHRCLGLWHLKPVVSFIAQGRLLSSSVKLTGSFTAGTSARLMALQMMSFIWLWRCCQRCVTLHTLLLFFFFFLPTSTKLRAWKLNKMLNNGCNDFLFGAHCVEEGDRIPPLQSYEQALKQKRLFLWCPGWWLWCVCQSPGLAQ